MSKEINPFNYLTVGEAAKYYKRKPNKKGEILIGCDRQHILGLIKTGKLPAIKVKGNWWIKKTDFNKFNK